MTDLLAKYLGYFYSKLFIFYTFKRRFPCHNKWNLCLPLWSSCKFFLLKMHTLFIWHLTNNRGANFIHILSHLSLFRWPTSVLINRISTCAAKTLHVELVLRPVTGCVCFVVPNINWWKRMHWISRRCKQDVYWHHVAGWATVWNRRWE
jgi:hypothetical protein